MKSKPEIINETVQNYNVNPRAVDSDGGCDYISPEGYMCAVGRCMKNPTPDMYGSVKFLFNKSSTSNLEDELKDDYKGHSIEFWDDLQQLHDLDDYWDGNTLTDDGKEYYQQIYYKWSK